MKEPIKHSTPTEEVESEAALLCSFCGKSRWEVTKLIAGPTAFICDECVELSSTIIDEERAVLACPRSLRELHKIAMQKWMFTAEELPLLTKAVEENDATFVLNLYTGKFSTFVPEMMKSLEGGQGAESRSIILSSLTAHLITVFQFAGLLGMTAREISEEILNRAHERAADEG